jgi:hypothetical protein
VSAVRRRSITGITLKQWEVNGTPSQHPPEPGGHRWLLRSVRYLLPAAVVLAGVVVMAMGSETDLEGGAGIVGAGLAIYAVNWLFRVGAAGEREREAEDAAREHFSQHGRWPT